MVDLTSKAMLVRLEICAWSARKHDKGVSAEVARNHNTGVDAGRYNKVLIAKGALEEITKAASAARTWHYEQTLPWTTDGARILPAANFLVYSEKARELRAAFESAVARFVDGYSDFVAEARVRLNGLFNAADYPESYQIGRRFSFDVEIMPIPDCTDFRVQLGAEEESKIRADIERRTAAAIGGAVADLWQRVHDTVAKMVERLRAYQVDPVNGKVTAPFRDSLVENVRDLVALLPRLNVTGDAALAAVADRLANELATYEPDTLRANGKLRETVAQSAEDILASMAGYCSAA